MFYHLKTPLFEEQQEQNAGGGDAPPAFDVNKFRTELKTELISEIRKDINAVDKRSKDHFTKLNTGLDAFKAELMTMLKPKEEPVVEEEEEETEEQASADPEKPLPGRPGDRKQPKQEAPKPPKKQQPSPHEQRLQRELDAMRAKQEELQKAAEKREKEAEAKEVTGILKEAISKQPFNNDRGAGDLFALLRPNLVRGEDGNLYGPEGLTVDEYVTNEYSARPFLHPAKNVNGSGAGPNSPNLNSKSSFDLDNIRPGMSAEETAAAMSAIAAAMNR